MYHNVMDGPPWITNLGNANTIFPLTKFVNETRQGKHSNRKVILLQYTIGKDLGNNLGNELNCPPAGRSGTAGIPAAAPAARG